MFARIDAIDATRDARRRVASRRVRRARRILPTVILRLTKLHPRRARARSLAHVSHQRDVIPLQQNPPHADATRLLLRHLLRVVQHQVHVLVEADDSSLDARVRILVHPNLHPSLGLQEPKDQILSARRVIAPSSVVRSVASARFRSIRVDARRGYPRGILEFASARVPSTSRSRRGARRGRVEARSRRASRSRRGRVVARVVASRRNARSAGS